MWDIFKADQILKCREEINRASAMSGIDVCEVVRKRCKPLERKVSIMFVISKERLKEIIEAG